MSAKDLEKRIVQMLSCDPNRLFLEEAVNKEHNVDFRYAANEFPIITKSGYGFLDIIGKDEKRNSILLLECKPDNSLLSKAIEEAEYYKKCLNTYGLFQTRNLIGLYHRGISIERFDPKITFEVKPLILHQTNLQKHSVLFSNYRTFMLEWISQNYSISSRDVEKVIPKDSSPIYLINRLENDARKSYVGFCGLKQALRFVKIDIPVVDAPLKLEPDKTNYETMRRIENAKGSNRFSIQFHRYGHSRPMLFFEVDDEFSACFVHTGRHQVELNGYYESAKTLTGTERIYGLIQVETGTYTVGESRSNRVILEIYGRQCHGEIKMNFLNRIYIEDYLTLTSTYQTTL